MGESESLDIIFTAPHPDDLEIGMGGTIAKLVDQGYRVGMLHMTTGEPTPRGTPETRATEAQAAAKILGVAVCHTLDLPNRELMDGPEARYKVATVFRRHRVKVVVGMAGRTPGASPDHYQAQLITEAARFYSQLTKWDDRFDGTKPHRIDHLVYRPVQTRLERFKQSFLFFDHTQQQSFEVRLIDLAKVLYFTELAKNFAGVLVGDLPLVKGL